MIRLLNSRLANGIHATVDLFADTKEEVTDNATIVGLESTTIMDAGSTVLTAYGDCALRNSSGEWIWQDDEPPTAQTEELTEND